MRRASILLGVLCAAVALLAPLPTMASAAGKGGVCGEMRQRLVRGGGAASGLFVIDAETGRAVCARAAEQQRPLASNMKLFTTSDCAQPLRAPLPDNRRSCSPTARSTATASFAATSTCRAPATPRWERPPSTTASSAGSGPTSSRSRRNCAGPGCGRCGADCTPTTASSTGSAASPTRATPRAPISGPSPAWPSTPATAPPAAAALPPTRQGWRPPSWPARCAPRASRSAPRSPGARPLPGLVRSPRCARRRCRGWSRRPTSTRTTSSPRC